MQLLANEKNLVFSNDDKIILTNRRISQAYKRWGKAYQITIFLENISSIENLYKSDLSSAIMSVVCFLVGIFVLIQNRNENRFFMYGCFFVGLRALIMWVKSKRQIVTITSKGGSKLNFWTARMGAEKVEEFIDKVHVARDRCINA